MQYASLLAVFALFAPAVLADNPPLIVTVYSDENCNTVLQNYTVNANSCAETHPGFSSMRIVANGGMGGTITAYTKNNCGCPTCGSHGYDTTSDCLKSFGFVGNAIGYHF